MSPWPTIWEQNAGWWQQEFTAGADEFGQLRGHIVLMVVVDKFPSEVALFNSPRGSISRTLSRIFIA